MPLFRYILQNYVTQVSGWPDDRLVGWHISPRSFPSLPFPPLVTGQSQTWPCLTYTLNLRCNQLNPENWNLLCISMEQSITLCQNDLSRVQQEKDRKPVNSFVAIICIFVLWTVRWQTALALGHSLCLRNLWKMSAAVKMPQKGFSFNIRQIVQDRKS